jgi:hypothetical protein
VENLDSGPNQARFDERSFPQFISTPKKKKARIVPGLFTKYV